MSVLEEKHEDYDPMAALIYGLKAPESKRQYPGRFKPFLDFLKLEGSMNEKAKQFWLKAKENSKWTEVNLMQFIQFQKERAESGQISPSTVPNYYKAIKLFCEMNEIELSWKKIPRGFQKVENIATIVSYNRRNL